LIGRPETERRRAVVASLFVLLCVAGCGGGPCKYTTTSGTCTITRLGTSAAPVPATGLPTDTAATLFSFMPDGASVPSDSAALIEYVGSSDTDPSTGCLAANHISVGAALPCQRQDEISGTCTPRIWIVPGFNQSANGCP
jgi:hypothetical protein